jgi:uncharacterized protein YjdB
MCKNKKISVALAFILTFVMLLNSIAVQAAQKQAIVPNVDYVIAPTLQYTAGDIVTFDLHSPNYGGRVQYRVILWDDNRKEARDLWTTGDRYYTKWMPYGNENFNLHFGIDKPGSYRITVYVKRAGLENSKTALKGQNCDSYMESQAFVVREKTTAFDKDGQTYGSIGENKLEAYSKNINLTANDVTFNNAKLEGDLNITGDNAVIRNVNIVGKLTINPGKDGSCTLDNVTAKSIEVLSGGQNSIHIRNSNIGTMNVNSNSPVRIEVDGDTEIVSTTANGYAIFDRKNGTYGTITITKDENGETVIEFRGNIRDKVEVESAATIKTGQGSSIANLVINTKNNTDIVKLEGQYKNIEITREAKLEVAANTRIENIIANNDVEIRLNNTAVINNVERKGNEVVIIREGNAESGTPPGNNDGGSNGGGSNDDGGYVPPTVAVSSISVTGAGSATTVVNGGTLQMSAVVTPVNAANKTVTWVVTNGTGEATISINGLLTGTKTGNVTVKAIARDGSLKEGTKEIIVINGNLDAPTGLVGVAPTTSANKDGKITGTTTSMEYKLAITEESAYTTCSAIEVTGLSSGDYVVRYAAKPGHNASTTAAVTVPAHTEENRDQTAPTGLVGVAPTTSANKDGKITGTTTSMEYKLAIAEESAYTTCAAIEVTGLSSGDYVVRYAAKLGYNPGATAAVTVPTPEYIYISSITVKTAPNKVTYFKGEALDLTGLSVTLTKSDYSTLDVGLTDFAANGITTLPQNGAILGLTDTVVTISVNSNTATQGITVIELPEVISVTVEPSSAIITKGDIQQLTATVVVAGGAAQTVIWTSSDTTGKVAVDGNGLVTVPTDAGTGNYTITATSTVDSSKFDTTAINVIPLSMTGTVAITGTEKFGSTLTAVPSLTNVGTPTYQWNRAGKPIPGAAGKTYNLVEADIGKTITVTITADDIAGTGAVTGIATGVIGKADGPAAPAAPILADKTNTSITLTANSLHEFSINNGTTWQDSPVFTGLTELTPYTFIVRVKATSTTNESDASAGITITTAAAVSASASPMAAAPGLTTITLNQVIPDLASSDINVMKNGVPLANLIDYNISVLESKNVEITFLPQAALDRTCTVTVEIVKFGYFINNGSPITIPNNIPVAVKSITVTGANDTSIVLIGDNLQMMASLSPENADDKVITWTVEPGTGTATIDSNGLLTGMASGTVTVKATNAASSVTGATVITIVTPAPALNQLTFLEGADQGNTQVISAFHTGAVSYKYKLQTDTYSSKLYVGMAEPAGFYPLAIDSDIPAAAGQHLIVLALDGSGNVLAVSDHILTADEVRTLPVTIYMGDYNNNLIQACTSTDSNSQILVPKVESNLYSGPMAITVSGGRIYWAEQDSRLIRSSALNGTDIRIVVATGSNNISTIAVDETGGRIYWADYTANGIYYTSLTGGAITVVIPNADNSPSTSCKGPLAMTISGQKIYWAGDVSGVIECADLDGSNRHVVIPTTKMPQSVSSIAVDEVDRKVYWSDYSTNSICCAKLDVNSIGTPLGIVVMNADKGVGIKGVLSIAIKNRRIYWVCDSTGEIRRARLNGLDEKIIYTPQIPTYISGIDVE